MRKKILTMTMLALGVFTTSYAGGLMTNTNYHIAFDRMMARGATFDIDAAYSNPAGLAWGHEGFQLSLNFQKPWQNRDIKLTTPPSLSSTFTPTALPSSIRMKARLLLLSCQLSSHPTRRTAGPSPLCSASWAVAVSWNTRRVSPCSTYCSPACLPAMASRPISTLSTLR